MSGFLRAVRPFVQPASLHLNPPVEHQGENHAGEDGEQRDNEIPHTVALFQEYSNLNKSWFLVSFKSFHLDKCILVAQFSPLSIKVVLVLGSFLLLSGFKFFGPFGGWGVGRSVFSRVLEKALFLILLICLIKTYGINLNKIFIRKASWALKFFSVGLPSDCGISTVWLHL